MRTLIGAAFLLTASSLLGAGRGTPCACFEAYADQASVAPGTVITFKARTRCDGPAVNAPFKIYRVGAKSPASRYRSQPV